MDFSCFMSMDKNIVFVSICDRFKELAIKRINQQEVIYIKQLRLDRTFYAAINKNTNIVFIVRRRQ